ncbi:hypothetical protein [Actinokineospora sp. NBRC 105648]|nr:hypothetical protein [Actinokineospora sp. NBRC 105648]
MFGKLSTKSAKALINGGNPTQESLAHRGLRWPSTTNPFTDDHLIHGLS